MTMRELHVSFDNPEAFLRAVLRMSARKVLYLGTALTAGSRRLHKANSC
jgi:hypothetical protein